MTSSDAAQRILDDPELLDRFAARYRGDWAPADALAWRVDPDAALPSGAASPTARLRELQHVVYSARSADDAGEAERELRKLTEELDRERSEVDRAIAAVVAPAPMTQPEADDRGQAASVDTGRPRRARPGLVVGVLGVAIGLALGAGATQLATLTTAEASSGETSTTPSPEPTADVRATIQEEYDRALEREFAEPQGPDDVPGVPLPTWLEPDSLRRVFQAPGMDVGYLASTNEGRVCLILVSDDGRYAASCAPRSHIPITGLSVETRMPFDDAQDGTVVDSFVAMRWSYNSGEVRSEAVVP